MRGPSLRVWSRSAIFYKNFIWGVKKWSLWFIVSLGCRRGSVTYVQFILLIMLITRPYSIIKKVKKLLVNVKTTVSCKQMCLLGNISTKMNFETLLR